MKRYQTIVFMLLGLSLLVGCGSSGNSDNNDDDDDIVELSRSFYLGFTPWPYEATQEAIDTVYDTIQQNGDIVAHHLMDGIPWQESLVGDPFPADLENEVAGRIAETDSDQQVYLAVDSLNTNRDNLALNWGEAGGEPLPAPWNTRTFADSEVVEAYVNFALAMIARFEPDYFNYGTEVSELLLNDQDKFAQFVVFAEGVYTAIKAEYPSLPLMVSVALKSPDSADAEILATNLNQLSDYVDMVGISVYPYAFFDHGDKGDPANLSIDWLAQINSLIPGKPVAVTETGWIAENLEIETFGLSVQSDPSKQKVFLETLFAEAENLSASFVIWFTVADYDTLWNEDLGQNDLAKVWKDTGLLNSSLQTRPAMGTWQDYLARPRD